jgi:hypothetical protein
MGDTATDHHHLRIDHMRQRGDSESDPVAELIDHSKRRHISVFGRSTNVDGVVAGIRPGGIALTGFSRQTAQRRPRCVLLPASLPTTCTGPTSMVDHHVTDLTGETMGTP